MCNTTADLSESVRGTHGTPFWCVLTGEWTLLITKPICSCSLQSHQLRRSLVYGHSDSQTLSSM